MPLGHGFEHYMGIVSINSVRMYQSGIVEIPTACCVAVLR